MTNCRQDVRLTFACLFVTLAATAFLYWDVVQSIVAQVRDGLSADFVETTIFLLVVTFLVYGNLVYLLTRIGSLKRRMTHKPPTRDSLETIYAGQTPALSVLVPSYREDPGIVWQTLISAALMEYPGKQVVLLIDDSPVPRCAGDVEELRAMRALPDRLQDLFAAPARRFAAEQAAFLRRRASNSIDPSHELLRLAGLYEEAARWLHALAAGHDAESHVDTFFIERILRDPAHHHSDRVIEFRRRALAGAAQPGARRFAREYRRLAGLFDARFVSFERKQFENLSHEANKAMNLNSYIGLMGRDWAIEKGDGFRRLVPAAAGRVDLSVPDADYIVTLDADSMVLNDYALRLISVMQSPGNARLAVAQTPYSAFPNAKNSLERIAGATTDIQYIVHQGFTHFAGTYWVGANAIIRRRALDDIAVHETERGFPVTRFIQDRTVIEDTESSVDLIAKGWRLYNWPERLAYSATPPDFGALLIQRRRWANGGLIILPKLLRYLLGWPWRWRKLLEGFVRLHYLSSLAGVSVGVLVLLFYPFESAMQSPWLPMTALPYFLLYGRDLMQLGYRPADLFRVYALNLLLIPINLGGVLKSLHQGLTGRKIPFARTPKVRMRTAAPPIYAVAVVVLFTCCFAIGLADLAQARWAHAIFALVSAGFLGYSIKRYIGIRPCIEDCLGRWPHLLVTAERALQCLIRGTTLTPVSHLEGASASASTSPIEAEIY